MMRLLIDFIDMLHDSCVKYVHILKYRSVCLIRPSVSRGSFMTNGSMIRKHKLDIQQILAKSLSHLPSALQQYDDHTEHYHK